MHRVIPTVFSTQKDTNGEEYLQRETPPPDAGGCRADMIKKKTRDFIHLHTARSSKN